MAWTEERIEKFKQLYAQTNPILSFSDIAAELGGGLSRSACIGKKGRLGLTRERDALGSTYNKRPKKSRPAPQRTLGDYIARKKKRRVVPDSLSQYRATIPDSVRDLPPDQSPFAVSLFDAQEHHCRWPLGEPTDFLFCGDTKHDGYSYCLRHCRIAYTPGARPPLKYTQRVAA